MEQDITKNETDKDFYKHIREKLVSHPFELKVIERPKRKRVHDKDADNARQRKSYHKRKEENPEAFKAREKERNAAKYAVRKADPVKWEAYLESCRRSKARKRAKAAGKLAA